ncbi:MAG: hypothetical protein ACXW0T_09250 [Methylobacter sp.]
MSRSLNARSFIRIPPAIIFLVTDDVPLRWQEFVDEEAKAHYDLG